MERGPVRAVGAETGEMVVGTENCFVLCFCFIGQELCLSSIRRAGQQEQPAGQWPPQRCGMQGRSNS